MTKIQGRCTLPPDHVLMTVPRDATFIEDEVSSSGPQDSLWRKSLSAVPKAITSYWKPQQNTSTTAIPSSYSALKSLVAVTQALFAATTLYNSKGHQIDRFGYAAFGLTVVPYALMSIVNLIANLVCPEYPAMYLISNQALQNLQHQYDSWSLEARQDKAARPTATQQDIDSSGQGHINIFQADHSAVKQEQPDKVQKKNDDSKDQKFEVSGIVGALSIKSDRAIQQELNHEIDSATYRGITDLSQLDIARSDKSFSSFLPSVLIITGVVIGIIGGLSHFHQGSSTTAQRVWTMIWLSFGLFIGIITYNTAELLERRGVLNLEPSPNASSDWKDLLANLVFFIIVPIPAIGGLVVVGQMIHSYGVCNVF
jgi:hypothetical protein